MATPLGIAEFAPAILGALIGLAGVGVAFVASKGNRSLARERLAKNIDEPGSPAKSTDVTAPRQFMDAMTDAAVAPDAPGGVIPDSTFDVILPASGDSAPPDLLVARSEVPEARGTVKFFNRGRGYGFITAHVREVGQSEDLARARGRLISLLKGKARGVSRRSEGFSFESEPLAGVNFETSLAERFKSS